MLGLGSGLGLVVGLGLGPGPVFYVICICTMSMHLYMDPCMYKYMCVVRVSNVLAACIICISNMYKQCVYATCHSNMYLCYVHEPSVCRVYEIITHNMYT